MIEQEQVGKGAPEDGLQHRQLLEALRVGIVVHSPDTTIIYSNPAAAHLLGLTREQIEGKTAIDPAWSFIKEDRTPMPLKDYPVNRVLATMQPLHDYIVGVDRPATSDRVWVLVHAYPEMGADQKLHCIVITFIDITALMLTEEALRESESIFDHFMEYSPVHIFFKDENLRALKLSRNYEAMTGKPRSELIGKSMDEIFPPDLATSMMADDMRIMKEGRAITIEEEFDGRFYQTTKFPIWVDGAPRYLAGYTLDITQLKREAKEKADLQMQLLQAQKMESVGRLAGGVAHDFNNMLMGILGYAELCRNGLPPEHPIGDHLDALTHTARRSADLTRQLLAFARKQVIAPVELDLNKVIAAMLDLLRRLIGENIELAWMPAADLWSIKLDPTQVDQIMVNLCVNARDSIKGTGKINIATHNITLDESGCASHDGVCPGDYVLLTFHDNGCGMESETLAHVFEPFFTTKSVGEGTGLGLSTVYGIVKQNNGDINVKSKVGAGTTFEICLPRYIADNAKKTDQKEPGLPESNGETVLVVEDQCAIREICTIFLRLLGYTALVAATPAEAEKIAAQHEGKIHVLLTDVVMPGMSGPQLAKLLTASIPELRVLYMSGYADNAVADLGTETDGVFFIGKPFSRDELACKLHEVLNSKTYNTKSAISGPYCPAPPK